MHDPKVVAFEIKRPWPSKHGDRRYWPAIFTVWHVEPGGADSLSVCGWDTNWQWHFWHWQIQWHFEQKFRRWLFERCEECGRRYPWGYAPISHQWDSPKSHWFKVEKRAYHWECSAKVNLKNQVEQDVELIRDLIGEIAAGTGELPDQVVERLTDPRARKWEFRLSYRLQKIMEKDKE